jgi:adenosylcobinamide kinase/adenosylcobinamide-phosphate guanylyltransferase
MAEVELILGGQKSGKSRRAEALAARWLAAGTPAAPRQATLLATADAWDDEMRQRIARHQADRRERVPGLATQEFAPGTVPDLGAAIARLSAPHHLLVVDCLTLWLTRALMPMEAENHMQKMPLALDLKAQTAHFLEALRQAPGPVVLVGNEIGLGVIPLGREVRAFVDALGLLNQQVAEVAQRVVLMVAGQPLVVKPAGGLP